MQGADGRWILRAAIETTADILPTGDKDFLDAELKRALFCYAPFMCRSSQDFLCRPRNWGRFMSCTLSVSKLQTMIQRGAGCNGR